MRTLDEKIKCNGIKPTKAEVYTLAAELIAIGGIAIKNITFRTSIIQAFKVYDYYYDDYDYDYDNAYDYDYDYAYDYAYDYYYYDDYLDYDDYPDYDYAYDYY